MRSPGPGGRNAGLFDCLVDLFDCLLSHDRMRALTALVEGVRTGPGPDTFNRRG